MIKDGRRGFLAFFLLSLVLFIAIDLALDRTSENISQKYFAEQARGFIRGRLDLPDARPWEIDLAPYKGKIYAIWPPLPALLMMPIVPFFPTAAAFPQLTFAHVLAAACAGFFFLIVKRVREFTAPGPGGPVALAAGLAWGSLSALADGTGSSGR